MPGITALQTLDLSDKATLSALKLLGIEDVARLFHLSPWTVRMYARTGKLPALRTGKHWRFRVADLESFIQKQVRKEARQHERF